MPLATEQLSDVELLLAEMELWEVVEETLQVLAFAKSIGGVNPMTNIAAMAIIVTVPNNGDFCILSQFRVKYKSLCGIMILSKRESLNTVWYKKTG
jgi:hypothetical protein